MQYWQPLTQGELYQLHEAACRILDELGVRIADAEAAAVLGRGGARQGEGQTVQIPRELVEWSIEQAPASFTVYDRSGGSQQIGGMDHHHLAGGTMTQILEYPGWTRRAATLDDVGRLARIVDALDSVTFAIPMVEAQDVPPQAREILSCAETLKNTTKFCWACPVTVEANEAFVAMAKALAGTDDLAAHPIVGLLATVVPGYEIDVGAAQTMLLAAREGIPIILMGGAIRGAQSPATMAGSLVMKAAEELAALCIVQSAGPGTPCLMDWGQIKLDMRTAEIEEAGPEYGIALAAGAQLARLYGIPSYSCPSADSKVGDLQAGFEFATSMMAAMLSGIHVTVNAGTAAKCSAASYELLVLHNEMLRSMNRIRRGMTVDEETLAVALQLSVGIRGDYLSHRHTLRIVRDGGSFLHKDLFDATGIHADWADPPARARDRWQQILRDHVVAVPESDRQALDSVVDKLT